MLFFVQKIAFSYALSFLFSFTSLGVKSGIMKILLRIFIIFLQSLYELRKTQALSSSGGRTILSRHGFPPLLPIKSKSLLDIILG